CAALFVNVMAQMRSGRVPVSIRWTIRLVNVLVLPVPAPATINRGETGAVAALCCSGFKFGILDFISTIVGKMKENYKPLIVAVFLVIAGFWVKGAGPQKTDVVEVRGALSGGGASIGPQILGVAKGAEFANPALLAENVAVNTVGVPEGGLPADADFTADGTVQDPGNPMGGLFTPGAPVATGPITYVVKRGDTLSGIAAHFGVSAKTILSANSSIHGKTLRIGLALSIPGVTTPATSTGSSAAT